MKKRLGSALVLLVLLYSAACASSRGSSSKPSAPTTDSGMAWSAQRATRR